MEYRYRPMRHVPTSTTMSCTTRGSFISAGDSSSVAKRVNREICVSCAESRFWEISCLGEQAHGPFADRAVALRFRGPERRVLDQGCRLRLDRSVRDGFQGAPRSPSTRTMFLKATCAVFELLPRKGPKASSAPRSENTNRASLPRASKPGFPFT